MAAPRCPRTECDGRTFSLKRLEPTGSNVALQAVCCSKCGAVVGVMDYFAVGKIVTAIAKKLGV